MKIHSKYTVAFLVALLAGLTSTAYAEVTDAKHTELVNKADTVDTHPNAVNNTNMGNDTRDGISLDSDATGVGDRLADADKGEDVVPEGLTDSAWKGIRQAYEQHRRAAVAVDGEFRARNPGQQWLTHFDGRGFIVKPDAAGWRWGLELQSYGFPGHQRSVSGQAKMTALNDRVTYGWDAGLSEWFVNDRSGLEHGFTLDSRPPGSGDTQLDTDDLKLGAGKWLELRLTVRGDLRAQGQVDGQGVSFVNQQGHTVVNYAGLKVWDADNRRLTARINVDAIGLKLSVDERNARYPLTIDPIAQQAYLKASNSDDFDAFGWSVAVSGDTVVVGAWGEASNATGVNGNQASFSAPSSGAAYVFVRDGVGVWSQQAYLKASNTNQVDDFGVSVAVSGDTVVVGAWREGSNTTGVDGNQADNSAFNSGAAYVFVRDGGGVWSQQAYLKASNTDASDLFGISVSVSGDTVVVGAQWERSNATGVNGNGADNSAVRSGAAYVFVRDGFGVWSQQAYLKASNTDAGDEFGWSVAVSGDTVVVGGRREDSNATGVDGSQADNSAINSGAAYVFVRDGFGVWSQQAYLKASNTDAGDEFGISVAVSGDTVVVGGRQEDSNATGVDGSQADNSAINSGAAYVFVRSGSVWSQQDYLKASNTDAGDEFAQSVAVSGDTVVVGAYLEDSNTIGVNRNQANNSAPNSGAAYVYFFTCGNGTIDAGEACDDGGTVDGDGCSSTCTVESGYTCDASEPSVCTDDDECTLGTDNCNPNATCTNTVGSFTCACNPGFLGDGVTCILLNPPVNAAIPYDLPKQKYISIDASVNGTLLLAIKIEETTTGKVMWAGAPFNGPDISNISPLSATPVVMDWSTFTVVHLTGCIIQPLGAYEITFVGDPFGAVVSSPVLPGSTACLWGDVQVLTVPPVCDVDIGDIIEAININTFVPGTIFSPPHGDLLGDVMDGALGISDITAELNSVSAIPGTTPPGYTALIDCP